jgi:hypothetical protein
VPAGTTPRAGAAVLAGVVATLLAGGVAVAAPAAAAQGPSAPQVTVLRGPSCDPGGIQLEVAAGDVGYAVRLATTRHPAGEDETTVGPGERAVLTSDDVAWGETIDPRLEYTALDGTGRTFADELDDWTMTRPSQADCAAIAAPASESTQSAAAAGTPAAGSAQPEQAPAAQTTAVVASGAAAADGAAARAVAAGGWITVRGTGFTPGETITVHLRGSSAVLGRGMAGPDGTALVAMKVPARATGPTQLDVVGGTSRATAGLRLLVAARHIPAPPASHPFSWPALAALLSLVTAGGGVIAAGRVRVGRFRSA